MGGSKGARPVREFPRYAIDASVEVRSEDGRVLRGRTRNVSGGGLCVELAEPLDGVDVVVFLALVFSDARWSEPLGLPARVVWCTPIEDAHQLGCQFRPLSSRQHTYLDMFLRYLADSPALDEASALDRSDDERDPFAR